MKEIIKTSAVKKKKTVFSDESLKMFIKQMDPVGIREELPSSNLVD